MINNCAKRGDLSHFANWSDVALDFVLVNEGFIDVLGKANGEDIVGMLILGFTVLVFVQPRLEEWPPADIGVVDEEYTTS